MNYCYMTKLCESQFLSSQMFLYYLHEFLYEIWLFNLTLSLCKCNIIIIKTKIKSKADIHRQEGQLLFYLAEKKGFILN